MMNMKNGIFFLTYDGYYNFTSGIGTQTKTLLRGIDRYYKKYSRIFGDFEINLIIPKFDKSVYGYSEEDIHWANGIIEKFGGKVYVCDSELDRADSDFWTSNNWERVSRSAASIIGKEHRRYKKSIIIAVDPPFLQTARYVFDDQKLFSEIQAVNLMYTSTYIHDREVFQERLEWERAGLESARKYKNIKIGDVCDYMHDHLCKYYGVAEDSFVPYHSSLFLGDDCFDEISQDKALSVLRKNNIPINKDIIFAFGRSAWVKGFDILIKGMGLVREDVHLVLLATEFEDRIEEYKALIQEGKVNCTLLSEFTRELPSALCQYTGCKVVVCPSRREPFSNIPLEVGLWAKKGGPIVLASNIGGYMQQINNGENGFIFDIDDPNDLAGKIDMILGLSEKQLDIIRTAAYDKVVKERDFYKNFGKLLHSLWAA